MSHWIRKCLTFRLSTFRFLQCSLCYHRHSLIWIRKRGIFTGFGPTGRDVGPDCFFFSDNRVALETHFVLRERCPGVYCGIILGFVVTTAPHEMETTQKMTNIKAEVDRKSVV